MFNPVRVGERGPTRRKLIAAVILSAILALLVSLLSNLAATYIAPEFATKPWLIYGALIITFIISLPITVYLFVFALPRQVSTRSDIPDKPYRELVGRDALVSDIIDALRDPAGKWIVAVDGMGGIGKTALVREVSEKCQAENLFELVVWDQAPRESINASAVGGSFTFETVLDAIARQTGALDALRLGANEKEERIRALLKSRKLLVVLDNLETAQENQEDIAHRMRDFVNPSKALLTSRQRFTGDLYAVHLTGLNEDSSLRLIRHIAEDRGLQHVLSAKPADLKQISKATGGSPMALKLVVGQLSLLSLEVVLDQLRNVRFSENAADQNEYRDLYKYIFFPSWRLLSEDGKQLLIAMANFAPGIGGTIERIKATSGFADDLLIRSLTELWRLSFLEVGTLTSLKQVRYYLHALTQNFVLSDILNLS